MNRQRYEARHFGVRCDVCGFAAIVTFGPMPSRRYSEDPSDRSDHCTHPSASDLMTDECPNWSRCRNDGVPLDEQGNVIVEE